MEVKARAETVIERPAEAVWARIRDFGDVSWVPNTASCRVDGDVRTITMDRGGFEVAERLLELDEEKRSQTYNLARPLDVSAIFGPDFKADHLLATLAVTPEGASSSRVTWDIFDAVDELLAGTHAEYQAALDHLKAELEG
jgi:hypothetical protein